MFTEKQTDNVFHALAHTTRRAMLDIVHETPGIGVGALAKNFEVSRIAIMNHLAVLEKADLIHSERRGRTRHLYVNIMPIRFIYERWSDAWGDHLAGRVSTLKFLAEQAATLESAETSQITPFHQKAGKKT